MAVDRCTPFLVNRLAQCTSYSAAGPQLGQSQLEATVALRLLPRRLSAFHSVSSSPVQSQVPFSVISKQGSTPRRRPIIDIASIFIPPPVCSNRCCRNCVSPARHCSVRSLSATLSTPASRPSRPSNLRCAGCFVHCSLSFRGCSLCGGRPSSSTRINRTRPRRRLSIISRMVVFTRPFRR